MNANYSCLKGLYINDFACKISIISKYLKLSLCSQSSSFSGKKRFSRDKNIKVFKFFNHSEAFDEKLLKYKNLLNEGNLSFAKITVYNVLQEKVVLNFEGRFVRDTAKCINCKHPT